MHTALIYEAIFLVFLPFGSSQKHRLVFLATALFVLTYFTLLSGCSASVLRASIMCSMFAIAYAFRKRGSGLNTLGISIVVILWFNPYQVWNLGFQLSVLAVIGILTLHQYISKQFTFKYKISTYLFEALSITVCAQITTLPVILYHFQSFPIYFIPANLVLIPISTIALFTSMASIFLVGLGISFEWLFHINQWLIELFSSCATLFASLPNSSIHPIHVTAVEAWIIIGIVCVYIQYPFTLNKKTILICSMVCFAWTSYRITNEYEAQHKKEILFISNGKKSALLSLNGLDASIYTEIPIKDFNQSKMKGYFNLRTLTETCDNDRHAGLRANIPNNSTIWMYKKSCAPPKQGLEHLFSYKEKDSSTYHPNHFHSLKTKKSIYFKMK
jgi:competence protein ComEC